MANQFTTYTTKQAAKELGVSEATFIRRAKKAGITPKGTQETGKRGRPALLWSTAIRNLTK